MGSSLEMLAGDGTGAITNYLFRHLNQPSPTVNMYAMHMTGSTTASGTAVGYVNTPAGTITHPTPAVTNKYTLCRRTVCTTLATANSVAGERCSTTAQNWIWRGNAARLGGFLYSLRFSLVSNSASTRMFAGITSVTAAGTMCSAEPSAAAGDFIGIGFNAANSNTNLRAMWKDGTTYGDADISSNAVRGSGNNLWDLFIYAYPNDTKIYMTLYDVYNSALALDEVAYSTNIPRNTIFMGPACLIGTASSSTTPAIGMSRTVIITPY